MIQANELRIGNLIHRPDFISREPRIEKILNLGDRVTTTGPIKVICDYEDIEPIPISEELIKIFDLLEIGDKRWRFNNYVIEHWYNMYLIKYISMTNQLIQIGTEIKYVHQFQNIAFALTQTELELK